MAGISKSKKIRKPKQNKYFIYMNVIKTIKYKIGNLSFNKKCLKFKPQIQN